MFHFDLVTCIYDSSQWKSFQNCFIFQKYYKNSMKYENAYQKEGLIFKSRPSFQKMPNRTIITNVPDHETCDNKIRTSKYTMLSFIPLNLIVQFSKVANIYFLIIGIMQMIDSISVSGGIPVIFVPLSIVIGVSAIKDFYEDLKRKKSDNQINNKQAQILREDGSFSKIFWKDIKIGDVIRIHQNQLIPADIIILQSSDDKRSCFVETKNLDGETNLKFKQVKYEVWKNFNKLSGKQFFEARGEFKYQRPNPYIHTFTGSFVDTDPVALDNSNVALRGCSLKITQWITGVVIYSGYDTKIMLNSNKVRQKKSRLEFKMGIIVAVIFSIQMILTSLSALFSTIQTSKQKQNILFSDIYRSYTHQWFVKWGSWILLFTNFVPISLIVSLEMVKYIQGINISRSIFQTQKPAEVIVQTSSLNEELGQIQHLFSDKTGTLTCNYMNFKYMVIGTNIFGYDFFGQAMQDGITNVQFYDKAFIQKIKSKIPDPQNDYLTFHMMMALSLCHNIILQQNQEGSVTYNASSPDQLAFINMAKLCGWNYLGMNANNEISVQVVTKQGKQIISCKFLHLIQFNSDRKRMSVIVQKDDKVYVYCKGADNVILQRLKQKESKQLEIVHGKLIDWSVSGLRTLLFSKRQIKKQYYQKWAKMYAYSLSKLQKKNQESKSQLKRKLMSRFSVNQNMVENVQKKQTPFSIQAISRFIVQDHINLAQPENQKPEQLVNKLINDSNLTDLQKKFLQQHLSTMDNTCTSTSQQLQEMIQKQLELIGATAIEDKLQDRVKQTIQSLRKAGIKVWMLTGDKKQTAINIGLSCGLISQSMAVIKWEHNIDNTLQQRQAIPTDRQCCIVLTGDDLLIVTEEHKLLRLLNSCNAIICCRVTPRQKQDMVWLMRKNRFTTLAIGDGANDVNMINTAHVGVGIKGVEGAQAALCSDYAISQFQILGELLLYHGRESYRKNSQLILFNFYKNLLLVLPQLWYGFNNYFSSVTLYDPWIYQLYNVFFTSLPIIIFAIYDQKFSVKYSFQHPQEYQAGLNNTMFNLRRIMMWFISPVIFSFFLCMITFLSMQETLSSRYHTYDFISTGMAIFGECVILCNLKVLILAYNLCPGLILFSVMGIGLFYSTCYLAQKMFIFSEMTNILKWQVFSLSYWVTIITAVIVVLTIQVAINRYFQCEEIQNRQKSSNKFQEIEMPMLTPNMKE